MLSSLSQNRKSWEKAADHYFGDSALPSWGPFGVGKNSPSLLGPIRGKTFLEIGCGSGHSIRYLVRNGAKHVYGLDFSQQQVAHAKRLNRKAIGNGHVTVYFQSMERRLPLRRLDVVFSIFALGWSTSLSTTLRSIHSYLRKDGQFVFSWEHPLLRHTKLMGRKMVVDSPYWEEHYKFSDWKGFGPVSLFYPTISTWFKLLTRNGFQVESVLEPQTKGTALTSSRRRRHYAPDKVKRVPSTIIFVCRKQ